MRLAFVLLLMTLAAPAWAEWVEYGSVDIPLISSYYDPTTIKKRGDVASVWIFTDLKTPIDGEGSRRALKEFNCKEKRNRTLQQTLFSGPMMSGEIDRRCTFVTPEEWKDTLPGSRHAILQSIVCK